MASLLRRYNSTLLNKDGGWPIAWKETTFLSNVYFVMSLYTLEILEIHNWLKDHCVFLYTSQEVV